MTLWFGNQDICVWKKWKIRQVESNEKAGVVQTCSCKHYKATLGFGVGESHDVRGAIRAPNGIVQVG